MTLDKIDFMIMEEIETDPRQSIRALAKKLGMKWTTVRYRLNRLTDQHFLHITCVNDAELLGYQFRLLVGLKVSFGKIATVANQLVPLPAVKTVFLSVGRYDIVAWVFLQDRSSLDHFMSKHLAGIVDIKAIEIMNSYRWVKDSWSYFKPQTDVVRRYPQYGPNEFDLSIIKEMQQDPRQTITKLAKTIGCSTPVAKLNLDRLIKDSIIRFVSIINPIALGYNIAVAILIKSNPNEVCAVANALAAQNTARYVSLVTGQWQIYFGAQFRDSKHMYDFLSGKLSQIPGIIDYEAVHIIDSLKYSVGFTNLIVSGKYLDESRNHADNS